MGFFGPNIEKQIHDLMQKGIEDFQKGEYPKAIASFREMSQLNRKGEIEIPHDVYVFWNFAQKREEFDKIDNLIILSKKEKIILKCIIDGYDVGKSNRLFPTEIPRNEASFMIITTDNLYFLYDTFCLPLEDIISIKIDNRKGELYLFPNDVFLGINVKNKKYSGILVKFGDCRFVDIKNAYDVLLKLVQDKKEKLEEDPPGKTTVIVNISSIKEYLKSGGVVIQTFKCPGCGASLEFPDKVDTTTCQYCGNKIKAVDILERIKNVI